jgi:hypothetical protein
MMCGDFGMNRILVNCILRLIRRKRMKLLIFLKKDLAKLVI